MRKFTKKRPSRPKHLPNSVTVSAKRNLNTRKMKFSVKTGKKKRKKSRNDSCKTRKKKT